MTDEEALAFAVLNDPEDRLAQLAWADWLEENGHSEHARYVREELPRAFALKPYLRELGGGCERWAWYRAYLGEDLWRARYPDSQPGDSYAELGYATQEVRTRAIRHLREAAVWIVLNRRPLLSGRKP